MHPGVTPEFQLRMALTRFKVPEGRSLSPLGGPVGDRAGASSQPGLSGPGEGKPEAGFLPDREGGFFSDPSLVDRGGLGRRASSVPVLQTRLGVLGAQVWDPRNAGFGSVGFCPFAQPLAVPLALGGPGGVSVVGSHAVSRRGALYLAGTGVSSGVHGCGVDDALAEVSGERRTYLIHTSSVLIFHEGKSRPFLTSCPFIPMEPIAGNVDRPWVIGHSGEGIRPHAASAT